MGHVDKTDRRNDDFISLTFLFKESGIKPEIGAGDKRANHFSVDLNITIELFPMLSQFNWLSR
jgi:hypothetical protein